jgi:hypothetical protein
MFELAFEAVGFIIAFYIAWICTCIAFAIAIVVLRLMTQMVVGIIKMIFLDTRVKA